DRAGNKQLQLYNYCTIADTIAPFIMWDTIGGLLHVVAHDDRPWDPPPRGVTISDSQNIVVHSSTLIGFIPTYSFLVEHDDPDLSLHFYINAKDEAENYSQLYFYSAPPVAGVGKSEPPILTLSLYPNPSKGLVHIQLLGSDKVEVR